MAVAMMLGLTTGSSTAFTQNSRFCADYHAGTFTGEVLGDSVAQGYQIPAQEKWHQRMAAQLPPNSPIWNGAVDGSLIEHYLPGGAYYFHVQFIKNVKPTVVFMNWRLNEQDVSRSYAGYDPASTKAKYLALINDIKSASPNTTFVIMNSPWSPAPYLDTGVWKQQDYVNMLRQLKDQVGALWLDFAPYVASQGEAYNSDWMMYDLVHPTVRAQRPMAAAAFNLIDGYCQSA